MLLQPRELRKLYTKRARQYDALLGLTRVVGADIQRYRRFSIDALELRPGDTVVDLGCGTGLNFPMLSKRIGPTGKIIGVDLTPAMLEVARKRCRRHRIENVELVEADMAEYEIPRGVDGVLSTFAIGLTEKFDEIIQHASVALPPGKRMVDLKFREPERWPDWLIETAVVVSRPFCASREYAERRPWDSMKRHFSRCIYKEYFFGAVALSIGVND